MSLCPELTQALSKELLVPRPAPAPFSPQRSGGFVVFSSKGRAVAVPVYDIQEISFAYSEMHGRLILLLRGGVAWTIDGELGKIRALFGGLLDGKVGAISESAGFAITPPE
jgi:hypothetical protein